MAQQQDFKKDKLDLEFLIVSDSYEDRLHLTKILLDAGYRHFEQADEASKAFGILKRQPVDIIICQWDMPNMSGLSLLKILSLDVELFSIPFFIVTSELTKSKAIQAGICGVAGILVEPITKEDIENKIEVIIESPVSVKDKRFTLLYAEAKRLTDDEQHDQALVLYKKMLKIRETAQIYCNIGHIKIAQSKFQEAFLAFSRAILVSNLQSDAYKKMGEIHQLKGNFDEAKKCFKSAGDKQLKREVDQDTIEALEEALALSDSDSPGFVNSNTFNSLGIIFRRKKNYIKAIHYYNIAIKVEPDNERIYYNLGRAYFEEGRLEEAEDAYQSALSIKPDFTKAKERLVALINSKS